MTEEEEEKNQVKVSVNNGGDEWEGVIPEEKKEKKQVRLAVDVGDAGDDADPMGDSPSTGRNSVAFSPRDPIDRVSAFKRSASTPRRGSFQQSDDQRERHLRKLTLMRHLKSRKSVLAEEMQPDEVEEQMRKEFHMDTPSAQKELNQLLEAVKEEDDGTEQKVNAVSRQLQEMVAPYKIDGVEYLSSFPLEVKLRNVTYSLTLDEDSKRQKIQTVFTSSVFYQVGKIVKRLSSGMELAQKSKFNIVENLNLVIQPGKQYLVLGPPGSGKSTLLKLITDHLPHNKRLTRSGTITYNGKTMEESGKNMHIDNASAYIHQLDKHAPLLTVGETLDFAFQTQCGGKMIREREGFTPEQNAMADKADKDQLRLKVTLTILGLTEVKDTFVGDQNVRGVSGGQRRRVTVGEMIMAKVPVLCGDEISTGLDASSTYDMVNMLLELGRQQNFSRVFSLLQPSPEVVSLFDEVIVLAEGKIIYSGPIDNVEDYFEGLGFKSPEFVDVADFLQMVSTEDREQMYVPSDERPEVPSVTEMANLFLESDDGKRVMKLLDAPSARALDEEGGVVLSERLLEMENVKHQYANNFFRSTYLITRRFLLLWVRDKKVLAFSIVRNVINGASVGGAYFNTTQFVSIQGAMFCTGIFVLLGSLQSSTGLVADRVLYNKQAGENFYSAWPYVFGRAMSQIPAVLFLDTFVSGAALYYLIGLGGRDNFPNFLVYCAILFSFGMVMNQQMAVFASFANESQLQSFGACIVFFCILFSGFIIPPDTIPPYYQFIYWWNPFAWAYTSWLLNETYSGRWPNPVQLLQDNGVVGPSGNVFERSWIRNCIIYLWAYFFFCAILTAIGLTYGEHETQKGGAARKTEGKKTEDKDGPPEEETQRIEIPFKPLTLFFTDLCYEVKASISKDKLMLLKHVNGIFRPGRMCALMGTSGAGKTTLMDVIALRKRSGTITGNIYMNGFAQDPVSFRRCSGYVEQFDVQSPELTVRETVIFSARLRLDPDVVQSDTDKVLFCDQILRETELDDIAGYPVGTDETGGLSFEQKKRLSIAVELAASPSIIFLDEPTSGLDSRSALLIVRLLRKISDKGRTCVATIHQPSSAVFEMFDDLLLLKKGGEVVYHGPLGNNSRKLINYFESLGATSIELGDNPANWMLRVLQDTKLGDLAESYKGSPVFASLKKELEDLLQSPDPEQEIKYKSEFATGNWYRRKMANRRLITIYWRSPAYNWGRVLMSLVLAGLLGLVFVTQRKKETYSESDLRARMSTIFFANIIVGIMAITSVQPVMTWIRDMFYRHRDAGMYDSCALGDSLTLAETGFILWGSAMYCIVFLSASGIGTTYYGMFLYWGFFTFNSALFSYFGQLFVCSVKSMKAAMTLSAVYIGFNNMFSGLVILPQELMDSVYKVTYLITPGSYVYEGQIMALMYNQERLVQSNIGGEFNEYLIGIGECTADENPCTGWEKDYVDWFFGGYFKEEALVTNSIVLAVLLIVVVFLRWVAINYIRFSD